MKPNRPHTAAGWLSPRKLLSICLLVNGVVSQVPIEQCSTENTSPEAPHYSIYQSHGACLTSCSGYAFGILQYQNCWCSNFAPSTSGASCTRRCPGYSPEFCGSDNGAFTYIALGPDPQGTGIGGGVGPTPSQPLIDTPAPVSSAEPPPMSETPTPTPIYSPPETQPSAPLDDPPFSYSQAPYIPIVPIGPDPDPTSSEKPSVVTAKPVTSIQVVTVSGEVKTQVVTQSPTPQPTFSAAPEVQQLPPPQQKHGLSNGAVAGITIGVLAGVGLLAGLLFVCWRRRRSGARDAEGNMRRNPSVLSKVGLLRGDSANGDILYPAPAARGGILPKIRTHGLGLGSDPGSAVTAETQMSEARRSSRPLFVDNRLNPNALMEHPNASRASIGTLQDDKDYTRPLEVRNPD